MCKYKIVEFIDSVMFVVVCYRMQLEKAPAIESLAQCGKAFQVNLDLLAYDNSPSFANENIEISHLYVHYRPNDTNVGVSACYNRAAEEIPLRFRHKQWLFLLDQDTLLNEQSLKIYHQAVEENPGEKLFCPRISMGKLGIAAPFYCRFFHNGGPYKGESGKVSVDSITSINSGLLIHQEVFGRTGGYNPGIPLDFSDYYFFHKYKEKYSTLVVVDTILSHNLSSLNYSGEKQAVQRFGSYVKGARAMAAHDRWKVVLILAFLRAVKMSIRYKTLDFIWCYFSPEEPNGKQ